MIAKSWWSGCLVGSLSIGVGSSVLAQVVPDNTLGAENSVVTPDDSIQGIPSDRIDGGATRGANLFHSFNEFSIPTGGEVYFNNAANIQNILSRVTGGSISNINGLLRANGTANLFLLNPNGIIFGPNAMLNIGGSFVGSTAISLNFADDTSFSATAPQTTPLLTVSVPIGLQYEGNTGSVQVQESRLRVRTGRTLALMGGDVSVEGGETGVLLRALGGRVELGGVVGVGTVGLFVEGNNLNLSYPDSVQRSDVSLTNGASINVATSSGGSIAVNARNLDILEGSQLSAGIATGLGSVGSQSGDITLNATGEITVAGSYIFNRVRTGSVGNGGNINITAGSLSLTNGAQLITSNSGQGNAGNVKIIASGNISFDGSREVGSAVFTSVDSKGIGNGGDIYIQSSSLSLTNGGEVVAGVFQGGQGNSGNVTVNIKNSINISGSSTDEGSSSGIFTDPEDNSQGQGGKLILSADTLTISDGGILSARTRNAFRGGDINIKVNNLELTGGGQILTAAFDKGNAGNITINATEGITISGSDPTFDARLAQFGRPLVDPINSLSGVFANTDVNSTGQGGSINITTGQLQVQNNGLGTVSSDRAVISSSSRGEGTAGGINLTVRDTLQAENGTIATNTSRSAGGNITIKAGNVRLFGNSDIRTDVASGAGGGGNITLTADSILAFDDSDILAFAQDGTGGNIFLNTPAFFGDNYRAAPRNTNPDTLDDNNQVDVNATGAFSGIVTIRDVSFIQNSLTELPENQINTDTLLANSCIVRRNQATRGSFTVTGTGGLPQRPGDTQMSSFPTVNVETLPSDRTSSNTHPNRSWQKGDPIVEPQGVYRLPNGKLVLSRECS